MMRRPVYPRDYQLAKVAGTDFILPPNYSPQSKNALETPVPLGKLGRSSNAQRSAPCSIHDRWFSLGRANARR